MLVEIWIGFTPVGANAFWTIHARSLGSMLGTGISLLDSAQEAR